MAGELRMGEAMGQRRSEPPAATVPPPSPPPHFCILTLRGWATEALSPVIPRLAPPFPSSAPPSQGWPWPAASPRRPAPRCRGGRTQGPVKVVQVKPSTAPKAGATADGRCGGLTYLLDPRILLVAFGRGLLPPLPSRHMADRYNVPAGHAPGRRTTWGFVTQARRNWRVWSARLSTRGS